MKAYLYLITFFVAVSSFKGSNGDSLSLDNDAFLLFSTYKQINKMSLNGNNTTKIKSTHSATYLDYSYRSKMVFWMDYSHRKIYKGSMNNNEVTTVINDNLLQSGGLAVDWIYDNIYFVDCKKKTIEVANFDGEMRQILIQDDLDEPFGIALLPKSGWMFLGDAGKHPKIVKVGMDGSQRKTIVDTNIKQPVVITLDLDKQRVYWIEFNLGTISSCDYNGDYRREILHSTKVLLQPHSFTNFENWMYWSERETLQLFKADISTGGHIQSLFTADSKRHPITGVQVFDKSRQPDHVNYCKSGNVSCSHFCLPAPRVNLTSPNFTCSCPQNLHLEADGFTCANKAKTNLVDIKVPKTNQENQIVKEEQKEPKHNLEPLNSRNNEGLKEAKNLVPQSIKNNEGAKEPKHKLKHYHGNDGRLKKSKNNQNHLNGKDNEELNEPKNQERQNEKNNEGVKEGKKQEHQNGNYDESKNNQKHQHLNTIGGLKEPKNNQKHQHSKNNDLLKNNQENLSGQHNQGLKKPENQEHQDGNNNGELKEPKNNHKHENGKNKELLKKPKNNQKHLTGEHQEGPKQLKNEEHENGNNNGELKESKNNQKHESGRNNAGLVEPKNQEHQNGNDGGLNEPKNNQKHQNGNKNEGLKEPKNNQDHQNVNSKEVLKEPKNKQNGKNNELLKESKHSHHEHHDSYKIWIHHEHGTGNSNEGLKDLKNSQKQQNDDGMEKPTKHQKYDDLRADNECLKKQLSRLEKQLSRLEKLLVCLERTCQTITVD